MSLRHVSTEFRLLGLLGIFNFTANDTDDDERHGWKDNN